MNFLVTGGAGFIGSHVVKKLLAGGNNVRIIDALLPQVHSDSKKPGYLPDVELIKADIRDTDALSRALDNCDVVIHLAAAVGVGQSQYEIRHYVDMNVGGTAALWQSLIRQKNKVSKVIVAGSMSSYGEGLYDCPKCGEIGNAGSRPDDQILRRQWELYCSRCGGLLCPKPSHESKQLDCRSVYAATKRQQEELSLLIGETYRIPTVVLRFFNVYGPHQSLNNPYTGVVAIFLARLLNGVSPVIYEDGNQTRDFISVYDLAEGIIKAIDNEKVNYRVLNLGTGKPVRVFEVAQALAKLLKVVVDPQILNTYRKGDIRHCFADIALARNLLGFEPRVSLERGLEDLVDWASKTPCWGHSLVSRAQLELKNNKLVS